MTRVRGVLAALAMAAWPFAVAAQSPKPSPAIKNTQSGIQHAQRAQLQKQATTKKAAQKVGSGGAHPDSEVPNNPGETSNKPGSGPGFAGGNPSGSK